MVIDLPKDIYFGIILVGGLGPANSGFILLHLQSGKKIEIASKSLFLLFTFLFDNTKFKWYIFAFLIYPMVYVSGYVLGKLFDFETSESLFTPDIYFIPGFLLLFFIAGAEEFGWRGFFQKELQKKYNPLITSIIIALIWTTWHLPLHYNGFYSSDFDFLYRFLESFQLGLLFTWLYNKSGYSLLTVMILHTMNNIVGNIFGSSYYPAMTLAIIIVIIFIIDNKM